MSTLFLILQGGLVGVVTGWAYPELSWEFWAICVANASLTTFYGLAKKIEDN